MYRENDAGDNYVLAHNMIQEYIKKYEKKYFNSDRAAHKKLLKYYGDQEQALLREEALSQDHIRYYKMILRDVRAQHLTPRRRT